MSALSLRCKQSSRWLAIVIGSALVSMFASQAVAAETRGAAVPTPVVTGPIASDPPGSPKRNYPFFITDVDLAGRGYRAEEFFFSGNANWYKLPVPEFGKGPFATAEIDSPDHAYKTRMMVYRPANRARFNGTVFVEWTNASSALDDPIWWQRNFDYATRKGYAFVTIATQCVQIESKDGLKNWSPERYGTLHIPDDRPCAAGTPGVDSTAAMDAGRSSYDVFGQGIKAIREVPRVMGGLPVKHVIAGGHSRSGRWLSSYVNAIHPRAPVIDGALLGIGGQLMRTDLDIPVLKVLSESEMEGPKVIQSTSRLPDHERFRTWWMTATSHVDQQAAMMSAVTQRRDLPDTPIWGPECTIPTYTRIASNLIVAAAMDALAKWVKDGTPPAHSPLPEWTATQPPDLVRDRLGNAVGGIRLATLAVPTGKDMGVNPTGCVNRGVHVPFDTATLKELYPSHQAYVKAVREAVRQNVRDGFLLKEDAADLIADAEASIVGTGLVCGPLCANVSNFLNNPSTSNLRDHTQIYHFRGGKALVKLLDRATRLVAEGYTAAQRSDQATKRARFSEANRLVQRYIQEVGKMPGQGRAAQATADLLVDFANILAKKIVAETV